jgi:hypothetical protein
VNAAFLLVTSAWLAGGQAPTTPASPMPPTTPPAAQAVPAPAYGGYTSWGNSSGCCGSTSGSYGSSSGGCGCTSGCNECEKPGFLDRLRARFARGGEDCGCGCSAAPTCSSCAPAPSYHVTPTFSSGSCSSCESSCDSCGRPGFLDRLRARFHRDSDCGCSSCGGNSGCGCASGGCSSNGAVPLPPAKVGEPLPKPVDGPMKLPSGDVKPGDKPTDIKPGDKPTDKSSQSTPPKNIDLGSTGGDKIIDSGTKNPF